MAPKNRPFDDQAVARVFDASPPVIRKQLLRLRRIIFDTAAHTPGVGRLEETLKWGQPAYLTKESGSGSAVRIDAKPSAPDQYAMYFHCGTTLIETFRAQFLDDFVFEGNRAIVFRVDDGIAEEAVASCVVAALTYHLAKKRTTAAA